MVRETQAQDRTLHELLKELAKRSFDLINGGTILHWNRECITITDGGGGSSWIGDVPSFQLSLARIKKDILTLPEFVQCVDRVHESNNAPEGTDIEDLLVGFLCKLAEASVVSNTDVSEWKPLSLDFDVYATTYKSFEDDLSSGNLMVTLAPLRGFESKAEDFDLGDSFRIRIVTPEELVQLWYGHEQMSGLWNSNEFRRIRFCIIQEHPIGIAFDRNGFDTIVTALRLWKTGDVGYDAVISLPKWSGVGGSAMAGNSIYFGGIPVTIESTDLEQFKNFYAGFRRQVVDSPQFLRTTIQRFNDSYERKRREDELLDNVIGLEALVSEGSGDLSWKVSRRIARLLETDPARRKEVGDNIKWAYNARNDIAHGTKPVTSIRIKLPGNEAQRLSLYESVPVIKEYLRRSIKKFIELGQSKPRILTDLDFGA